MASNDSSLGASATTDGVRFADLDTVFRDSDAVTLHCPLTAENRELTFVFADGAWSYQISEPGRCPDGRPTVVHDRAEFALPVPASDPIEKLTGKRQLTTDAPCAGTTDGTVLVERIGD